MKSVQVRSASPSGGSALFHDRFARADDDAKVGDLIDVEGHPHRIVEVHLAHVIVEPIK